MKLLEMKPASSPGPALDAAHEARIAFLFRTTQRQGRIHPLLHLLQQHRAVQTAAGAILPKVPG